ncbi:nose resistant to fluoxetine protein 6-like [Diprion similis]|uniref:nose resistant to fluoxetine protein 6-like n=1 Tax=Diprion similis TaxID=362088 RepID=UPI001EF7BDC0|nr:nose resistant to fluoxetine protein 6-like [Diprion similis]XP_046748458.1 nose resistant to fluoxetine protein 6-like [Diprion similis]
MPTVKQWTVIIVGLTVSHFSIVFAGAKDTNIWKTQRLEKENDVGVELVYENDSESMLPLLSRDLTLLGQAIDMISNDACKDQCKSMMAGIHNLTSWAVKFYDSSGKFPDGVLGGSLYQLGNFDECLQIGLLDDAPLGVNGQYCLGEVGINVPDLYRNRNGTIWKDFGPPKERSEVVVSKLHWGICVPAACQPQDVEDVVRSVLAVAFSGSRLKLTPRIPEGSCYKRSSESYNNLDIAYIWLIFTLIFLVFAGTAFHLTYLIRKENIPKGTLPEALVGFSLILNMRKLNSSAKMEEMDLSCISGIKVIAMLIIITGHSLIFIISGPVLNLKFWQVAVTKVENAIFVNSPLLVDTFLLLSGFLITMLVLDQLNKGHSINFLFVYLLRYIRLTPAYFVVVGFYMTWFTKLGSGPMWSRIYVEQERCLASWWSNILYINNYVNTDQLCMFQSWYLSVDTQLFVLAPLVIYPLHKWRRAGEFILAGVTALSVVIPFVLTLRNHLDPTLLVYSDEMSDLSQNHFFATSYIKTHTRASSYCFGLVFGYIVHRIRLSDYKLSSTTVRIGWLFASLSLIGSMFTIVVFYGPRKNFMPIEAAFYASLHRVFWSLGTGWIILACVTKNGGVMAKILQWKPFLLLSRLTYCAYLMNGIVVLSSVASTRSPQYLDFFALIQQCTAHWVVTFFGALVLSMTCESPILRLEKLFLPRGRQKANTDRKNESQDTNTTDA